MSCHPGPKMVINVPRITRRELYSLAEKTSLDSSERGALDFAKTSPMENEPRILAVHDPSTLDSANEGLCCDREDTTTASYASEFCSHWTILPPPILHLQ